MVPDLGNDGTKNNKQNKNKTKQNKETKTKDHNS